LLLPPSGDESSASGFLLVHEIHKGFHKGSSQYFTPKPFFSLAAALLAICCRRFFSLPHTMVLALIYGKRVSFSCDLSDLVCSHSFERDSPSFAEPKLSS
jgi:hypothetical protein